MQDEKGEGGGGLLVASLLDNYSGRKFAEVWKKRKNIRGKDRWWTAKTCMFAW